MKIGVIGLGLLGGAIAKRLVDGGHHVIGFDIRANSRQHCGETGVEIGNSSLDVAAAVDVLLLSLPDSDAVERVLSEIESALPGKLVIDTTTGDPERAVATNAQLRILGIRYIDAAVAGSSKQAAAGEAVILAGGREQDVNDSTALLQSFAQRIFHMGPCGSGQRAKLAVNLVLGLNRAALAEGLVFAQNCGIDALRMLDVLQSGPAYSRAMDVKGRKMVTGDFEPEARLRQHHKDVRLMLAAAARVNASLPLTTMHDQILAHAEAIGLGESDNSAVYLAIESMAHEQVR